MKHKKTLLAFVSVAILCFAAGYAIQNHALRQHTTPRSHANVHYFFEFAAGSQSFSGGNEETDIGERWERNFLGFNNVTNTTTCISVGNSSIAATNTQLDAEATTDNGTRSDFQTAVTWMNGTDYAYNVTYRFCFTGTIQLNASGIHWNNASNSNNNLYALFELPGAPVTFNAGDNATITWVMTQDNT